MQKKKKSRLHVIKIKNQGPGLKTSYIIRTNIWGDLKSSFKLLFIYNSYNQSFNLP